ncbi:CapA family protein [Thermoactinomyces intermedius]|jgi:gamma-polyglutamate biosynthesis protein CapA|uniref:CapA family protein n=1 Tax=Thermoactinomyces intermedius TaxID=2024 RepID=A0A8I1AA98_THEIN|nr:CapA family protein [Thermoactinomyces intermedius]MBA4549630.1 CapA family protein [Thermoactinomyces intermedius]MBA4835128.1 CapA family protein [Thermoactinomyces intermedius]MBH8595865.1 CapA family protein [Thermoactinomyces intermedius]
MLTWKQKFQRYIKRQKKKTMQHALIALGITVFFIVLSQVLDSPPKVEEQDDHSLLTISMAGDMLFGRYVDDVVVPDQGYHSLFQYVRPYLKKSDYITGNFDQPVTEDEDYPKADKRVHISTKPEIAKVLKEEGFTTVNLANNHIKDYGKQGLLDTVRVFQNQKVNTVGAGYNIQDASTVSYQMVRGIKIATLGFSDILPKDFRALSDRSGVAPADPDVFFYDVAKAKKNADLVIVHMHWGEEYDSTFHPRQQDLGRSLIDAGADIVIGHHPHVLEPVEVYKHGVIFYSLGNFISDQGWSRTRESVLAQYKVMNGKVNLVIRPLVIRDGTPRPLTGFGSFYRRERIFMQITDEPIFSEEWSRLWKREGEALVRTIDLPPKLKAKLAPSR